MICPICQSNQGYKYLDHAEKTNHYFCPACGFLTLLRHYHGYFKPTTKQFTDQNEEIKRLLLSANTRRAFKAEFLANIYIN